ncbi:MAG: hypothetical protein KF787_02315 [Phycisphaeraceae bacterium]|nr:hypothetical protein [Phycisphaerae bacterium]MBX3391459.1 hypothetical protein [Phycisphaeraceae bacterium]HRJ50570.1 hypothetical protein [Phycisphaerales bacterium]
MPDSSEKSPAPAGLLFTAFEPSGDDHASEVIAELHRRHPVLPIYAWGGPKMERAGATIVERTGHDAVMGIPGISKIFEHLRVNSRVRRFVETHPLLVHVPVDSPAANTPLARIAKSRGVKVVNLVAPQFWAWAPWRASRLRRISDLVLCILPFEEAWFNQRRIPARYVGHMLFDRPLDGDALDREAAAFPAGSPRIALMPGSRPGEIRRNWPVLLNAFRGIRESIPAADGMVAATTPQVEADLRDAAEASGGWPERLGIVSGATDAVIRWADIALVVSGTVTLQIAKQIKPMIVVYKTSRIAYTLIGTWLLSGPCFSLPNLIAGRRIVPEFVPYFGDGREISREAVRMLSDSALLEAQRKDLASVVVRFRGMAASARAADAIESVAGLRPS